MWTEFGNDCERKCLLCANFGKMHRKMVLSAVHHFLHELYQRDAGSIILLLEIGQMNNCKYACEHNHEGGKGDGIVVVLEITSVSDPRKLMFQHST